MLPNSSLLLLCALSVAAGAIANATVDGVVNGCDRSLITGVTAEEVRVDNNTLTCIDGPNSLMAIEFESVLYKSLKCDEINGWSDGFTYSRESNKVQRKGIAKATEPIAVKCVEYCAVNEVAGLDNVLSKQYSSRQIACVGIYDMFFNNTRVDIASCDFEKGWKITVPESRDTKDADKSTELQIESRKKCRPYIDVDSKPNFNGKIQLITGVNRSEEITMSLSAENEGKTVFKCNREEVNGTKWGIMATGKRFTEVFPQVECDSATGYTVAGEKIASPYYDLVMLCAILPEPVPTEAPQPGPPEVPAWTPSNDAQSSEDPQGEKIVIIICCMVGALFLVIICIVATCIKRMRAEPSEEIEEESQERKRRREHRSHSNERHSHERKKRHRRRDEESEVKSHSKSESRKKRAHRRDESTMEETDDVSEEV